MNETAKGPSCVLPLDDLSSVCGVDERKEKFLGREREFCACGWFGVRTKGGEDERW